MKQFKVFFSWQADLPANKTKRCLEESIDLARSEVSEIVELVPDEATRNRFGSPDIMTSIFEKIDECDLFIADVSIVGSYSPPKDAGEEDLEHKFFPNPNVLFELGYAAATKTWDRCICFANTDFGAIKDLPFDINHRRVTAFSYTEGGRRKAIADIAEIIRSTVLEYLDKPLPKKGFSHHIVGGYNLENSSIEQRIIPYNPYSFSQYSNHTAQILDEAKALIDKISDMHLPPPEKENIDFDAVTANMTAGEVMKDPKLAKEFSLRLTKAHAVKLNRSDYEAPIKERFSIDICDDFCDLGGLQESTFSLPFSSSTLEGTELEKEKYTLLLDLQTKLTIIDLRHIFAQLFDDVCIIPLSVKNISAKHDERITIEIKVIQGTPIQPTSDFFNPDYVGIEGIVFDEHLVEELLKLPENRNIRINTSGQNEALVPYIPHTPRIDLWGYPSEPESDEADYEQELQDYVFEPQNGCEYHVSIDAIRPNEVLWLGKVMLIHPNNGQIVLDYSIKSKNSTGELSGRLSLILDAQCNPQKRITRPHS